MTGQVTVDGVDVQTMEHIINGCFIHFESWSGGFVWVSFVWWCGEGVGGVSIISIV